MKYLITLLILFSSVAFGQHAAEDFVIYSKAPGGKVSFCPQDSGDVERCLLVVDPETQEVEAPLGLKITGNLTDVTDVTASGTVTGANVTATSTITGDVLRADTITDEAGTGQPNIRYGFTMDDTTDNWRVRNAGGSFVIEEESDSSKDVFVIRNTNEANTIYLHESNVAFGTTSPTTYNPSGFTQGKSFTIYSLADDATINLGTTSAGVGQLWYDRDAYDLVLDNSKQLDTADIVFRTRPTGGSITERMKIAGNGAVTITSATANGNIPHACYRKTATKYDNGWSVNCNATDGTEIVTGGGCNCQDGAGSIKRSYPDETYGWSCQTTNYCTNMEITLICCKL